MTPRGQLTILFRWGPVNVDLHAVRDLLPVITTSCDRCGFLGEFFVREETPLQAAQARAERLARQHVCWQSDRFGVERAGTEAV